MAARGATVINVFRVKAPAAANAEQVHNGGGPALEDTFQIWEARVRTTRGARMTHASLPSSSHRRPYRPATGVRGGWHTASLCIPSFGEKPVWCKSCNLQPGRREMPPTARGEGRHVQVVRGEMPCTASVGIPQPPATGDPFVGIVPVWGSLNQLQPGIPLWTLFQCGDPSITCSRGSLCGRCFSVGRTVEGWILP